MSETARDNGPLLVQPNQGRHFDGWGTSICWFGNIVGGFPDPFRQQLVDLIFDPKTGEVAAQSVHLLEDNLSGLR